jgi:hypothetical protein
VGFLLLGLDLVCQFFFFLFSFLCFLAEREIMQMQKKGAELRDFGKIIA